MNLKVIEQDEDDIFVTTCPSFSGCISQEKTEEEALENNKEVIAIHIECLSEDGLLYKRNSKKKEVIVSVNL
ncbi:MAG: type II toxin-antitoxin system HicB family antitoxin [Candidatus Methanofastidiosia archaeon]|jgi:predicted RNase H-like HicB family nuclease